jgi:DNA (cytosine-5)-methyltransferase 1
VTFGSLFAGIGGLDLGLERAGMTCKWQVEINPYACRVLAKHWPDVPRHNDIRTFPDADNLDDWRSLKVDLICGGFPCQDISYAGKGAGLDSERSGLWFEYARVVRVLRPRFVLVENVSALLVRGLDVVLGDLASLGFDAEWDCLPASAFGAYHERDRLFILAYRQGLHLHSRHLLEESREGQTQRELGRLHRLAVATRGKRKNERLEHEPRLARLVHGFPDRAHRTHASGNAVDPRVAEWLGRRLIDHHEVEVGAVRRDEARGCVGVSE